MKNCKHCQTSFEDRSRTKTALFCNINCKNTYWYKENKERSKANSKSYIENNKEAVRLTKRTYVAKRRKEDLNFRLASNLRARMSRAVEKGFKKSSLSEYLGCSVDDLKIHLESKFLDGMTWDNYGKWEIDHISPLSSFDLSDNDQLMVAANFNNLQPLWEKDNLIKGSKYGRA